MNIKYYFKNLDSKEKDAVSSYIEEKKIERLKKLVKRVREDNVQLDINIEKTVINNMVIIKLHIHLPKEQLIIEEEHHDLHEAIDVGFATLIRRVRKLHEKKSNHIRK